MMVVVVVRLPPRGKFAELPLHSDQPTKNITCTDSSFKRHRYHELLALFRPSCLGLALQQLAGDPYLVLL